MTGPTPPHAADREDPGRVPGLRAREKAPTSATAGRPDAIGTDLTIDCADCGHRGTPICGDCVVTFILGRHPDDAVVVDADEARAVRLLERAGLVPGVRHTRRAG